MTNQRMQVIGFFTLLIAATFVVLLMVLPYFKLLALAGILAVLFLPMSRKIIARTGSEVLGAALSVLLAFAVLMVPVWMFGQLLFNELAALYGKFKQGQVLFDQTTFIHSLPQFLQNIIQTLNKDIATRLSGLAGTVLQSFTDLLLNLSGFFLAFFFVFFVFYYLLRDGNKIKKYFNEIFPLSETHENLIVKKLEQAISGVMKGSFLVALCQGGVALIGFLIFGVPQPVLWAAFTVLAALVPTVGTSLSLIPAIIYLFISGQTGAGVGLTIWGAVAVGSIDNFISPRLIGNRASIHPILVFLGVIGGLQMFGVIGFLLGPILMAVFITLLDIYRTDLKAYLEKE